MMSREELKEDYLVSAGRYKGLAGKEDKVLLYLSVFRFICFAGGLAIIIYLFAEGRQFAGITASFGVIILFFFLLKLWSEHSERKEFLLNLSSINANEALAITGDISKFDPGNQYVDSSHDFSYDVDLFGDDSLFRYLNRTVTGYGRDILAGWLADPYPLSAEIHDRQEIISEFASKKEWRHEFMASGMKVPLEKELISSLKDWLSEPQPAWMSGAGRVLIWALPALALASLVLLIAGIVHYAVFVLIVLVNLGHTASGMKGTNSVHRAVSGKFAYLSSMNRMLEVIGSGEFGSVRLKEMKEGIGGKDFSASAAVKKLGRIIQSFDSRMNLLVGFGLNALLLWDFHCIRRLNRWKMVYHDQFPLWLEILGKFDAYSSLGNLAYNNPAFVFPQVNHNIVFSAKGLGHPLIEEGRRIGNDFSLENRGGICIITGANMAGKSTFLRTVAINYVLGMTGCPVCAGYMDFTPVKLFTSMRTTDSLSGNESYFYAELKRLKALKQMAESNEPVFFILDEILKGTNSADKSLGSRLFLKRLIHYKGTGLIATHDISLGELEKEHPENVFNMCFEIEIDGEAILFDYKLSRGITKKMNAAFLMRQMGILG
jgi:hypothetical protein